MRSASSFVVTTRQKCRPEAVSGHFPVCARLTMVLAVLEPTGRCCLGLLLPITLPPEFSIRLVNCLEEPGKAGSIFDGVCSAEIRAELIELRLRYERNCNNP